MTGIHRIRCGPVSTNCYIVSSGNECMVIDPAADDPRITRTITENGLTPVIVVLTHMHFDHTQGASALASKYPVPVAIGEFDAAWAADPEKNGSRMLGGDEGDLPVITRTLKDHDTITVGEADFEVILTPGHSPGGVCLYSPGMLFSGDTLFFEGVGRTDLHGGDNATLIESIGSRLYTLPDSTEVYPGHGPKTSIGHEKAANPHVRA